VTTTIPFNNMNIESIQVFDGKTLWSSTLGMLKEIKDEKTVNELRENLLVERAGGMSGLLKNDYDLSSLGAVKVKGKEAIGIRASKKGQRDLNLYFDKKTHHLVKTEFRTRLSPGGDKEVTQEKYFSDMKEVDGIRMPSRIVIEHDGKPFMELDISDVKMFE